LAWLHVLGKAESWGAKRLRRGRHGTVGGRVVPVCAWVLRRVPKEKAGVPNGWKKFQAGGPKAGAGGWQPSRCLELQAVIGPQWPLKTERCAAQPAQPGQQGKKPGVCVRETDDARAHRPKSTNWAGKQDKKPKNNEKTLIGVACRIFPKGESG